MAHWTVIFYLALFTLLILLYKRAQSPTAAQLNVPKQLPYKDTLNQVPFKFPKRKPTQLYMSKQEEALLKDMLDNLVEEPGYVPF